MRNKIIVLSVASGDVVASGTDGGVAKVLDTTGDILICDVRALTNIVVSAIQLVDAGTTTLNIEASYDFGVSWALVTGGNLTDASFPAGANTAVALGISDARGMQMQPTQIRARAVAVAGGGSYSMAVSGQLLDESR